MRLDLALFVGTPVLIIPAFIAASKRWSNEDLFLIVSTFGALGHHAPGLMRAYGDRQLFRRFRLRFTLVPIATLTLFSLYSLKELPGVMLVLLFWGLWHFLMQTYGFARIYDAKTHSFDAATRRLDLAVCIGWFGTCILFAPIRVTEFLSLALKSGLDFVLNIPLDTVRMIWLCGTMLATVLFVANVFRKVARGESVNLVKILLFVTTFSFFWLCMVNLTNLLLGIVMFEVFHDIQYLSIVWLFNRNRVKKEPNVGSFTRFLFRPGRGWPGVYLSLVFAYGFIGFAAERLTSETLQHVLFAIVASSNILHFYYDGFIWKIRDPETGSALGVVTQAPPGINMPGWFVHASKWAVLLVVLGGCLIAERGTSMTRLQQARAVVDRVPGSVIAQNTLAKELVDDGNYREAVSVCRAAEHTGQPDYRTHMYLGVALTAVGQPSAGFRELQRALELNPHDAFLRFHLAMGNIRQHQFKEALVQLKASVAIQPNDPAGQYNLGVLYLHLGQPDDAIASLRKAIMIVPEYSAAYRGLAEAYLMRGATDVALGHLRTSLRLEPDEPVTHQAMAGALRESGQIQSANDFLANAVRLRLKSAESGQNAVQATRLADLLLEHTNRLDPHAFELAARCYAAVDRIQDAAEAASHGAKLAAERGDTKLSKSLDDLAQQYADEADRKRNNQGNGD
jgi:tetratricopeptide (TPR) repeat protein